MFSLTKLTMVQRSQNKGSSFILLALAIVLFSLDGRAQGEPVPADGTKPSEDAPAAKGAETKQCLSSFSATQRLRREGKLLEAQRNAISCAQHSCPAVTRGHCVKWLEELRTAIPTIVVTAKTATGEPVVNATVVVDGKRVADILDGRPIQIDPGPRVLTITVGSEALDKKLVIIQGQKSRTVEFTIQQASTPTPAPPDQPTPDSGGVSPLVWIGFGVAGAGVLVGAITGGISLGKAADLDEKCQDKGCLPSEHDTLSQATTLAHVSTASFVVAGVGAILGITGLFLGGGAADESPPSSGVAVRPLLSVGYAGIQGRF